MAVGAPPGPGLPVARGPKPQRNQIKICLYPDRHYGFCEGDSRT